MYELIEATEITPAILIRHNEDGTDTFIPIVRGNADYEEYLNPQAEQSTPIIGEHLTEIVPD